MKHIRENCLPPSQDKLPTCFYHIIKAIFLFPYALELAATTSGLPEKLNFRAVPSTLAYLVHDAMRTISSRHFLNK